MSPSANSPVTIKSGGNRANEGRLVFDHSKPDGTPRKLLDVGRLTALGWKPCIPLREGIEQTYRWFREHHAEAQLLRTVRQRADPRRPRASVTPAGALGAVAQRGREISEAGLRQRQAKA